MKLYYLTRERLRRDFDDDGKFFLDNLRVLVGAVVSSASVQFKFPFFFFFCFVLFFIEMYPCLYYSNHDS